MSTVYICWYNSVLDLPLQCSNMSWSPVLACWACCWMERIVALVVLGPDMCWRRTTDSRWTKKSTPTDYRHLLSKTPHPKFQCWTKLYILYYIAFSAFWVWLSCPQHPSVQPKDGFWGRAVSCHQSPAPEIETQQIRCWELGDARATTIQEGFDFIVHLR